MDQFRDHLETWNVRISADSSQLKDQLRDVAHIGQRFSRSMINSFEGIAIKGKSLGEVLRSLAQDLSKTVLKTAFKPLGEGFSHLVGGLLKGGFGFLKGGANSTRLPTAFAKGGVIHNPLMFPFSNGSGILGERGAEAIMPLSRGADGRLGVSAVVPREKGMNITFNVYTPDVQGFRRSEGQLSAMLARVVSSGHRNL